MIGLAALIVQSVFHRTLATLVTLVQYTDAFAGSPGRSQRTNMHKDDSADIDSWSSLATLQFVRSCRWLFGCAFLRFAFICFLVSLILTGLADPWSENVAAQVVVGGRTDDEIDDEIDRSLRDTLVQKEQSVFIPAPREVIRPLLRADRAIKEKEITRAVSLLGEVLSDATREDFLVPVASSVEGVSTSLRLRAQGMLGSLPRKDRKLYRLRYGIQAKKMLEKALQGDDFSGVSQVMQRFFFTDAGFDAAMLLGHYHLDEGRPVAAANCFARVTGTVEGRAIHDPEASVLLATCWMLGDSPNRARQALTELKKTSDQDTITFMGRPVQMFAESDQDLEWLEKLIGDSPLQEIEMVNQWVMSGGNPQRNARSGTGFPLIKPRWSTVTLNNPDVEKSVVKRQRDLIHLKSAPIPAVQPLAVGDTIVMRAFDRMIGVDFKTGKRVWVFPPADFTANVDSNKVFDKPRVLPKTTLTERLWQDSIYGQASSDGQRIFVVPKPGFSAEAARVGSVDVEPFLHRSYNELKAVDIERQGAFVWEVGGETGLDEPKLAKALFLGAPLPLRGELFAVCRQESEVLLVVLDSRTGKLNWQQRLGTTETSIKIESDRYRRLLGATPSFADGIVVCSTGTGALVGVDLSTRSLLWGYQYTSPGKKEVQPISPGMLSNSDPLTGLWRDSAITIADGKVLFTPVDSQEMICVDLHNGFPGYERSNGKTSKSPRGDALLVACVEGGLTVLLGETGVRAISLATGNPVWKLELGEYGKPSGRGYSNRGCYFFPTTSEHIVQVELKTGKLIKAVGTDGVLGNLICHKGDVLSHCVDRLSSYPQDEPEREMIELALKEGQLTHQQLAIKSQLQFQDGDLRGAIESIESAFEQTQNRGYQSLLLDLILQMMESDFKYGSELAQKHADLFGSKRKLEYLTSKIGGQILDGQYEKSVDDLFEMLGPIEEVENLSEEFIEIPIRFHDVHSDSMSQISSVSESLEAESADDRITMRLDLWIASRLGLIYEQLEKDQRSDLVDKVNDVVAKLANANANRMNAKELNDLFQVFPQELIHPEVRLRLFSGLVAKGEYFQANQLMASLGSSRGSSFGGSTESGETKPDKNFAAHASAVLADHWVESGFPAKAIEMAEHISSNYSDVVVSGETLGADFASSIRERLGIENDANSEKGVLKFNEVETTSARADTINLTPCRIVLKDSDSPKYAAYQFRFLQQTGEFFIKDANGKEIHKFYARSGLEERVDAYNQFTSGRISIKNDLALVDIAQEMFVFDFVKLQKKLSPVLWYKSLTGGERDHSIGAIADTWGEVEIKVRSRAYENRVFVSPIGKDVVCYFDAPHLIAVDTRTGEKIWQRPSRHQGSVLLGDEDYVTAWNATKREAAFYCPTDGRLIAIKKLPPAAGSVWQAYGTQVLVSNARYSKSADELEDEVKGKSEDEGGSKKRKPQRVKTLGLYDLFSQKSIWEKEYPIREGARRTPTTLACRVGLDRIAVLPPGEKLQFIDVKSGKVVFATRVKLDRADRQDVDGIGVAIKRGKYLIHLKRGYCPSRTSIEDLNIGFLYVNYSELSWLGTLICVDSQTGQDLWDDHVRFEYFQVGQNTPFDSPLYVFIRRFNNNESVGTSSQCQVVGINIENGQQVFNSLIHPMAGYQASYHFVNDPDTQEMTLNYDGYQAVFKMSYSDDAPPTPVAHLLKRNSIPPSIDTEESYWMDTELIKSEQKKVLRKAMQAEELLAEKRAREKRLLDAERKSR